MTQKMKEMVDESTDQDDHIGTPFMIWNRCEVDTTLEIISTSLHNQLHNENSLPMALLRNTY